MNANDVPDAPPPAAPASAYREVRFRHSRDFVSIIESLGASLLVSTYQAGKLVTVGARNGELHISRHNFEQAMGIALHPQRLAVGSRGVIWFLQDAAELAGRLDPPGKYDACFLARQSFITGNIHGHEMAWVGDELWVVNTLFSCLCTLHEDFSFVPRWKPPFITELAANDRCHMNGLALENGRPTYVTAMAASNEPGGWRPTKAHSGRILEIASGQAVTEGLAMPHSPRVHGGHLWVLNSGLGSLEVVDRRTGKRDTVTKMPGYTRGLAFHGNYAFVGLSRIRETAVFGGVPIAENRAELKCAVTVVDMRSGQSVAFLEFESGVEEIFDLQMVAGAQCVSLTGPYPSQDDAKDVWIVPPEGQVPQTPKIVANKHRTAPGTLAAGSTPATLSDDEVSALVQSGEALHQQGRAADAVEVFERAAGARPRSARLLNLLGNALQDTGRTDLAVESYERAIAVEESFVPAHQNLGYLLVNLGRLDQGVMHLTRAQQLQPADVNRVMLATSLPIIYASIDDLKQRRERLEANVQQLVDEKVSIETRHSAVPTNFYAACQGYNDRDLQRNLSRLYPSLDLVKTKQRRKRAQRLRVGFLSAYFRDHTIGRLNLGRIRLLDREKFEVVVISAGRHADAMAAEFKKRADQHVELSSRLEQARQQVADLDLDLLFFADVGMNTLTYTLAQSRMAPVQCVTWGHPVTTGNPSIDYFVSSRLLEPEDGESHYTERLVLLSDLGTYYYRPKLSAPLRSRESFGLDSQRHLYLCPQTLFKLHPEFDAILAEILRGDPLGDVVLIEGQHATWTRLIRERFARTMPDVASRVRFVPPQPNADFLQLNAVADVLLDTIHFSGGNTSYEGLAMGTPIVTLPGPFLRSRITLALYRKMGVMDCVVQTPAQYVECAVRLATDREAIRQKINDASHILFEDPAEVRSLEEFLTRAANGGSF